MHRSLLRGLVAAPLLASVLYACSDTSTPTGLDPAARPSLAVLDNVTLLDCEVFVDSTATETIGTKGGTLALNGHRMDVPKGAVKGPKTFRATVPSSRYMEVRFEAEGQTSFNFEKTVGLTIDYSRCSDSNLNLLTEELRIYYIDPVTKDVLQDMGGVEDKTAKTVTAGTDHLSAYAIGSPN